MATEHTHTNWDTSVRCYKRSKGSRFEEKSQTIPENDFCISMPDVDDGPMGRPIDANLAVHLIGELYKTLDEAYGPKIDADLQNLTKEQLIEHFQKSRVFLNMLVDLNYGMTIDKNFALKLLSQPKCEGLRGYLCLKGGNEAPLSLVTVGIDKDGYDLKYNTAETVTFADSSTPPNDVIVDSIGTTDAVKNVKMRSLNGEYVTPPYTFLGKSFSGDKEISTKGPEFYSRFILLNIPTGKKDLLDFSNSI